MWFHDTELSATARSNNIIYIPLPPDIEEPSSYRQMVSESQEQYIEVNHYETKNKKHNKHSHKAEEKSNKLQNKEQNISQQQIIKTNMTKVTTRSKIRKGKERQTSNLSKYLFGIFKKLFQVFYITHKLNHEEVQAYGQFLKCKGKLKSYQGLMKHQIFRNIFKKQMESSSIVKTILMSERMKLPSKLIVFKFLQNIRNISSSAIKRWKIK